MAELFQGSLELLQSLTTGRLWVVRELTVGIPDRASLLESEQLGDYNCINLLPFTTNYPTNYLLLWMVACYKSQVQKTGATQIGLKKGVEGIQTKSFINISNIFFERISSYKRFFVNIYHCINNFCKLEQLSQQFL